jgi:hypothetical protein
MRSPRRVRRAASPRAAPSLGSGDDPRPRAPGMDIDCYDPTARTVVKTWGELSRGSFLEAERARLEVNVLPSQAEQLAAPHPGMECDGLQAAVAGVPSQREELPCLLDRPGALVGRLRGHCPALSRARVVSQRSTC